MLIHITPSYKPAYIYGGTTASVSKLCECLTEYGCDLIVLTTTANGDQDLKVAADKINLVDGVMVMYCKRILKDPFHLSISLLSQLYRLTRNNPSVIVHIHSWWNLTAIFSLLLTRLMNITTVLSTRGMITDYTFANKNSWLKILFHHFLGKHLLKYPHIHATGIKEQKDILQNIKAHKIFILPNLIHFPRISLTGRLTKEYASPHHRTVFKLLFLSRIQKKKGLELLFKALKDFPYPWQLTIAGTGTHTYMQYLQAMCVKLKICDSIIWTGQIPNESKYEIMAGADILVLPSYNENFGNVVLESLLSGTAVIVSECVGLSDYIRRNKLGWVMQPSISSLTQNLILAYTQSGKRNYIRKTAPGKVRRDFDQHELTKQYIQYYSEIV